MLLNKGNGTFAAVVNYAVAVGTGHVVAADLNADGRLDLTIADRYSSTVNVLLTTCIP